MIEKIKETASFLHSRVEGDMPRIAIILGTGLGALVDHIEDKQYIPYTEIPNMPVSTVEGHSGNLIFGRLAGKRVIAMQGRFHYYEGYDMKQVTFPVRVFQAIGVSTLFVSNAAGGMNKEFKVGDIMTITDHINLFPENPLRGKNYSELGPRFPAMTEAYDPGLMAEADTVASNLGIRLMHGVYVGTPGPTFETPAEYEYFRVIGGETKRIYVIANEASIHPAVDWEGSYAKGATLTPAAAADLQMASQWTSTHEASPYIDNTGSTRSYIPMSEYFDIPIADASSYGDGQQPIQSETLFVTRSTVKFAFYIDSDNTISTESFRFAEIAISGLAEKQYLFPCNTTYSPAKYPLNVNSDGRVITTYTTPPSLTTAPYVFTPVDFGYNAGGASSSTYTKAYAPQLYFLESPVPTGGDGYQLTAKVEIDNTPEPVEFGPVALPNLPSLPRNTFVKVYFSFTGYTINCEVKVVPYVEIALDPDYGSFGPGQDSPIISWPSGNN